MKIGLVRRGFSPTGGAEAYLRRFAEAAARAGHPCVLFATEDWPAEAWSGEMIQVRGQSPLAFADQLEARNPHRDCDFLFSLERVWRCDAYRAGDGIHAAWLERRAEYEAAWKRWLRPFNRKHAALLTLEKSLFTGSLGKEGAGRVIVNSRMVQGELEARFGYPKERITVVYNGLPPFEVSPQARQELRQELGLGAADYVLLFVGSGWERKGLRFAIEALAQTRTSRPILLVAGRGQSRKMPQSSQVRFLGPRSDIGRVLSAADAFILPTLYEPFSNACLEGLAAGLPVITTAANGFAEIINPLTEGSVITEPSDLKALATAIDQWADPLRRRTIAPDLRQLGQKFSIEENLRQTLAALGVC